MPKFTMHAREFKTMRDPNRKPYGHVKYICYLDTATIPKELRGWSNTNPRDQKMTTDVAKTIIDSLAENDDFHELNRGLLFSVESVHYDNRTELLTIELTNNDIHGNIDGGHTLRAIFDAQTAKKNLDARYVFAEFFVGITSPVELAAARNTSVQVDLKSQEELKKSFESLKSILEPLPFEKRIAYHMNQHYDEGVQIIDVREIITILNMFNQNLYPVLGQEGLSGDGQPIQSYTGKEVSLKRFLNQGKELRERILENMRPIIEDIFCLWEAVEREFPQKVKNGKHQYGVKKYAKYNKGEIVGRSLFYQEDLIYLVPKGIVYPVTGAFRALVSIDTATGKYAWKKDPLDVWNILGDRLAAIVWDEKEENPEYLGKSRNLWSNLFKEVLLYTLV